MTMGAVFLKATGVIVFITVMTKVMKKDVQIMKVQKTVLCVNVSI